jgi:hypothetical protein
MAAIKHGHKSFAIHSIGSVVYCPSPWIWRHVTAAVNRVAEVIVRDFPMVVKCPRASAQITQTLMLGAFWLTTCRSLTAPRPLCWRGHMQALGSTVSAEPSLPAILIKHQLYKWSLHGSSRSAHSPTGCQWKRNPDSQPCLSSWPTKLFI